MAITWKNFYKIPCRSCGLRGAHKFSCSKNGRDRNTFHVNAVATPCPGCGRVSQFRPCTGCLKAQGLI